MDRRRPSAPPVRPLVLLIDDHQDTLALYAIALSAMGFEVMSARDAADAFTSAWTHHPDVIVTEIHIGSTHSWDLLARLRTEARTREIPVIVLTGDSQTSTEQRARDAGCSAFLVKPCLPDQLGMTIRHVVSSSFAHVPAATQP